MNHQQALVSLFHYLNLTSFNANIISWVSHCDRASENGPREIMYSAKFARMPFFPRRLYPGFGTVAAKWQYRFDKPFDTHCVLTIGHLIRATTRKVPVSKGDNWQARDALLELCLLARSGVFAAQLIYCNAFHLLLKGKMRYEINLILFVCKEKEKNEDEVDFSMEYF